jgi:serine/threonine protein kinase
MAFPTNNTPLTDITVRGEKMNIPARYVPEKLVGKGAYGIVCTARDEQTGEKVAIKKNRDVFSSDFIAKRVLRELKILSHLKHPNIVSLKDVVIPQSYESFNELYFVTDLMETDLRNIM